MNITINNATATDLATLDRAALRSMYRTLCTEQGVEIDRSTLDKATALRTAISTLLAPVEAEVVTEQIEVEAVVETVETENATDLLAMIEEKVAAATGETKKREMVATAKFTTLLSSTVELVIAQHDPSFTNVLALDNAEMIIDADTLTAAGWSKAYTTMRNGWGKSKPGGLAAAALGYTCTTRSDKTQVGGFVVVLAVAA